MTLEEFLNKITHNRLISFDESMAVIADYYAYQATEFSNGIGEDTLINAAGTNEGSCKIFAFAMLHQLTVDQTLQLFGDYYREEVLNDPQGSSHQNIRTFIKYGWDGIAFKHLALSEK